MLRDDAWCVVALFCGALLFVIVSQRVRQVRPLNQNGLVPRHQTGERHSAVLYVRDVCERHSAVLYVREGVRG